MRISCNGFLKLDINLICLAFRCAVFMQSKLLPKLLWHPKITAPSLRSFANDPAFWATESGSASILRIASICRSGHLPSLEQH